jgi:oligopeptidase B
MATPASIIDFNMKTKEKVIRKEQVLGGSLIRIIILRNVFGLQKNGTQVPISMVYKKV